MILFLSCTDKMFGFADLFCADKMLASVLCFSFSWCLLVKRRICCYKEENKQCSNISWSVALSVPEEKLWEQLYWLSDQFKVCIFGYVFAVHNVLIDLFYYAMYVCMLSALCTGAW